jgi:hypothetical protein
MVPNLNNGKKPKEETMYIKKNNNGITERAEIWASGDLFGTIDIEEFDELDDALQFDGGFVLELTPVNKHLVRPNDWVLHPYPLNNMEDQIEIFSITIAGKILLGIVHIEAFCDDKAVYEKLLKGETVCVKLNGKRGEL